ncbi:AraC family transcriptional regulator [Paenibacillus mendelii]|uniref:Effector binding domain-containing protein n=1 Tax=Paenibacillus mendelii TaxID=206163 RepID=A0ABV6J1Q7_9BACL|nr:AraC family transcriptional regulator [Paenibacillus mendelii]MCQ6563171.1 AraC family transcriptional regulator [Paenibacillus mendelii]
MSYMACFQKSIDYIEEHLKERITVEDLADIAGFSPYHFYRLFDAYVGMPVMEYVRRRRLAYAAAELSQGKRIIDIAMEYGFETHAGFGKAFRKVYACSPEYYRQHASGSIPSKINLMVYQNLQLTGGIILEPKIITKPGIGIIGYALETTFEGNRKKREIPAFWAHFNVEGLEARLYELINPKEHGEFCICFPPNLETGSFTYVIGVKSDSFDSAVEGMFTGTVPEATYAVFTTPPADYADGGFVQAIAGTWRYIYEEWFPGSGYEFAPGKVDFEFYDERCHSQTGAVMEIYIPIIKRV